ncbi:glycosyltransferase family 2 protein [Lentibacillus sediminis]|uniref:glycosyltransferase family 2 protein n=1 Tax=Lentibacillus sediminis TaxID=1940529 RepID=UPI000C1C2A1F|nr:glycosyltransferase family 2 protein [Lentibacillus sediminis]
MNDLISIIIPAYNEAANIKPVHEAVQQEFASLSSPFELLFIDDGSSDPTLSTLQMLAGAHPEVKYISFTRNFGKEAAIIAGLDHAHGKAVIIMDADMQHPPSLIPQLLEGYREGYEQVVAKRNRNGEAKSRSFLSHLYYKLINRIIQVELHDGEGDFRLLGRKAVDSVLKMSEGNRFSKGLFSWIGFEQKTVYFENVERESGASKWSFRNLLNYGVEGVVSFNQKPLRICLYAGVISLVFALFYILAMAVQILRHGIDVPGYFTLISAVLFLGGVQLLSLGVIGEYVGRIYMETKNRPHYLVRETNTDEEQQ